LLDRGSRNRLQRIVGDATVAFWADTSGTINEEEAVAAENAFAWFADPPGRPETDDDRQASALSSPRGSALRNGLVSR
jgi:CRISPR-associated protein Csd1